MSVSYEWDVEFVSAEETDELAEDDIIDHHHCDNYSTAVKIAAEPTEGIRCDIVLVRDDASGRSWAYVEDGKLPKYFEDAFGVEVHKVPKRFHLEVEKQNA